MGVEIIMPEELIEAITALSSEPVWYNSFLWVAVVSGCVAIIGAMVTHLFNQRSEKRREETKIDLNYIEHENRKIEKMHEKQVSALELLCSIREDLLPNIWPNPDYDHDQAYSEVVDDMFNLLKKLDKYLKDWNYLLPESIDKQLRDIVWDCNDCYFHPANTSRLENELPSKQEMDAAEKMVTKFDKVVLDFKKTLGIEPIRGKVSKE